MFWKSPVEESNRRDMKANSAIDGQEEVWSSRFRPQRLAQQEEAFLDACFRNAGDMSIEKSSVGKN